MPNNGWKPSRCRACGKRATPRNPVSFRGLHGKCAEARVTENVRGIATRTGPAYERWRAGMVAGAERLRDEMAAN